MSRLLASQGGAIGAAGALIDQPALQGAAISLTPKKNGAQVVVHSILDPKVAKQVPRGKEFEPDLVGSVPKDAMAYLGLTRLDQAGQRLLAAGLAGGGAGRQLTTLLDRAQRDLSRRAGVDLEKDVLPLLQGEVALVAGPQRPRAHPHPDRLHRRRAAHARGASRAFRRRSPACSRRPGAGPCPGRSATWTA